MQKTKVFVITSSFPRYKEDYAGVFIHDLLLSLTRYGYVFDVLAPSGGQDDAFDKYSGGIISVFRFRFFFKRQWERLCYADGMLNNFCDSLLAKVQLPLYLAASLFHSARHIRGCQIIWSHWGVPSGLVGAILRKYTGKKHILSLHSGWRFLLKYGFFGKILVRFIIHNTDRITVVNKDIMEETIRLCRDKEKKKIYKKIILLPMGIPLAKFICSTTTEKGILRSKYNIILGKTVLYIGRLIPLKGIEYLIEAVRDSADLTLMIAGSGSDEARLRALSRGAKCDIRFLGVVAGEKKEELFRVADVVVVPSVGSANGQTEGLPVVILEAMASGVPVIATGIGGIKEVIKSSYNGLLVRQADAQDLRDKVDTLLSNENEYRFISENSRETSKSFDLECLSQHYSSVFDCGRYGDA